MTTKHATPLRLLLVEDDEGDEALLVRALERGGYDVTHRRVTSQKELEDSLGEPGWDLVISDFALPGFDGSSALECVKRSGVDIPFIMASGTIGEERAVEVLKAGAVDFVLKDRPARLVPAVQRELREAARRTEQRRLQERLTIAERLATVGTLAAGLVHEINNPLLVVRAHAELIGSDMNQLETAVESADREQARELLANLKEALGDCREALDRVNQIVLDVKRFSRSGDEERRTSVDLHGIIEAALRMVPVELRHRARIVRDFAPVPAVPTRAASGRCSST
jgi:CheY-like chemotaxis protein